MKKVILIHGLGSHPDTSWFPWLKREIIDAGFNCVSLKMPNPKEPKKDEWVDTINKEVLKNFNANIYLLGHSLGCSTILNFLQQEDFPRKISGVVLVSGRCISANNPVTATFYEKIFNWDLIKKRCDKFILIHGDNDKVADIENSELMSRKLGCELIRINNGGHLTKRDGFEKLEECKEVLLRWLV